MLMVAGGPVEVDEELPPQLVRETLMASQHISAAAHRAVLQVRLIRMILEANLAVAQVQKRGIQSASAFNPACHIKLLTARRADTATLRDTAHTGIVVNRYECTGTNLGDM